MLIPTFESLRLEMLDSVVHVQLNRPALGNRFDAVAHMDFIAALDWLGSCDEASVVVLSAAGKVFSAGGDFDEIVAAGRSADARRRMARDAAKVFHGLIEISIPVIAAVQGAAVGLGATLVSLCDITVAYRNAKIADPHVVIGLTAGDGGIIGWTQAVGIQRAKRYLLTGDSLTAAEGHGMGLITDLVDTPEAVLPAAMAIAHRVASLPRGGVAGTKRAFARLTRQAGLTAFEAGLNAEMQDIAGPEVAEAVARFKSSR
jgi:enoyl-CoA hydratase